MLLQELTTAVAGMLEVAVEGMSNLCYNVCPCDNVHMGRRPAYLFELLRRAAAAGSPSYAPWGGVPGVLPGPAARLCEHLQASGALVRALSLWTSAQVSIALL